MNARLLRLFKKNGADDKAYGQMVNRLIREKYSLSEELSILRKQNENPEEFAAYNAYAEECKKRAKKQMEEVD